MSAKNGTADEDGAASENHTVNSSNNHEMSSDSIVPILPPIAPADGLGLDRVNDILDFEIEHIFNDRATRNEHYQCLSVSRTILMGYPTTVVPAFLSISISPASCHTSSFGIHILQNPLDSGVALFYCY